MALPHDPIMLLSMVNLKLRDFYPSLDALCDDLDEDKAALCATLAAAGSAYSCTPVSTQVSPSPQEILSPKKDTSSPMASSGTAR